MGIDKHFLLMLTLVIVVIGVLATLGDCKSSTPQMGWNSWNKFACDISESLIKETADAIVATGLADLGYNYINLDDCWQASSRTASGQIEPDAVRFPSGLKDLGDYIHAKNLKFGIYSSAGFKTCQAFPASLGLESTDASSYASWGVDYLKYDNCYQDHGPPKNRYGAMKSALSSTGRDIFYSLCEWGRENPAAWAPSLGADSWRISGDIRDSWKSIIERAEIGASLWRYSGPNAGWNDPDMLEVGNGGCNSQEYVSHFSLWAMLKAPMIIGNDVRNLTTKSPENDAILRILGNKEVIAVSQDPLGRQGRLVWSDSSAAVRGSREWGDKLIATKCASGSADAYEDQSIDQEWSYQVDGTIKSASSGKCLAEMSRDVEDIVASLLPTESLNLNRTAKMHSVSTMDCASATKWDIGQHVGGSIVSRSSQYCLEVAKEDAAPVLQGKHIQTAPCLAFERWGDFDVTEHQSWTAPSGRLLNLYQRSCLTVDRDAMTGVGQEVWSVPLTGQAMSVILLNKGPVRSTMTLTMEMLGADSAGNSYGMRDLWTHKNLDTILSASSPSAEFTVESHGVVMLKLTPL